MPYKDPEKRKAYLAEYHSRPENRAKASARKLVYHDTPQGQDVLKRAKAKYRRSDKGRQKAREDLARYSATPEGKAARAETARKYASSPEGKAKIAAAHKRRWTEDPNYRLAHLLRGRLNKALHRSSDGSAIRLLGCTFEEFKTYIEGLWQVGMTWANHGIDWHLDHVTALGLFDLTDPAQLQQAAHYTNLQPLFTVDHQRKTAADIALIRARKIL